MTLATAIIAGLACGYLLGLKPRTLTVLLVMWVAVLIVQTAFVLDSESIPPEDWAYVPVQAVIFLLGIAMIWGATKVRARLGRGLRDA